MRRNRDKPHNCCPHTRTSSRVISILHQRGRRFQLVNLQDTSSASSEVPSVPEGSLLGLWVGKCIPCIRHSIIGAVTGEAEVLNHILRTEKELRDRKTEVGNSIKCNREVYCGKLTYRKEVSGRWTTPTAQGDVKRSKLKIESHHQVRSLAAPTGIWGFFPSPEGCHDCSPSAGAKGILPAFLSDERKGKR